MSEPAELTMEQLRERIRAVGVTIADNRLELVRRMLSGALAPVRRLDSRAIKAVEPAVTFAARREDSHE